MVSTTNDRSPSTEKIRNGEEIIQTIRLVRDELHLNQASEIDNNILSSDHHELIELKLGKIFVINSIYL